MEGCQSPSPFRWRVRHSPRWRRLRDRKSTRLNSSHTVIYTLSLHDALPIYPLPTMVTRANPDGRLSVTVTVPLEGPAFAALETVTRSEEHTSELQSHRDLHSFPTRRSSDLSAANHGNQG